MGDNGLMTNDSLSLASQKMSAEIFKIDTSRLPENDLPRTFLIRPLTVRDNCKLADIRGFIS